MGGLQSAYRNATGINVTALIGKKITTINARVRELASRKRAPLPAEMHQAVKTLGSVEITAQQSELLTKQMAESGAQQGWLPS